MTRKPTWFIAGGLALGLFAVSGLRAQDRMNLQQFIDQAVQNSAAVQIVSENVTGAGLKVRESKSQYLPQVNVASSYTRISLVQEFDIPNLGHFKFGTPDNVSFRLGASEQVFTWGRVGKTVELNRIGEDLAQDGVVLTKQSLAYQVVPMFYGVLFTQEAIKVVDQTLERLQKKVAILEERYQAGLASDFDISLLKVQMSGLEAQKLDFQNNIKKIFLAYNRIAGRPLDSTVVLEGDINAEAAKSVAELQAESQALLKEALENRPEARQNANQQRLVQTQMDLARTANKPNLIASFNYELRNGFLPTVSQVRGNWNAVLAVSYPVFDGHRTAAQVAETQVALRTVQEQAADLEQGFSLEIDQTLADLRTLEQKVGIELGKIAHAERALEIADERYQRGLISTTDLVDAQDSLDSARLNYLQLRYNYVLGRYSLLKAAGRKIYS
jgi:outer membrane protein TolC